MQLHTVKGQQNFFSIYKYIGVILTSIPVLGNLFQTVITAETWGLFFVHKQNGRFAQWQRGQVWVV